MTELRLGSSPRGALGLLRTARVRAALDGRTYVVPSDVQALVGPVLGHRMLVAPAYEASGGTASDAASQAVAAVAAPPGAGSR
jgi:MoxR-like ATPase